MDYSHLLQTLVDSADLIILGLVGIATKYVINYTQNNVKNDDLRTSLITSEKMLESAVLSAIGNLSASTKKALADGSIDKEDLEEIKKAAYANYKEKIEPEVEKRLEAHIKDVQGWVLNSIESKLESANKVTNV